MPERLPGSAGADHVAEPASVLPEAAETIPVDLKPATMTTDPAPTEVAPQTPAAAHTANEERLERYVALRQVAEAAREGGKGLGFAALLQEDAAMMRQRRDSGPATARRKPALRLPGAIRWLGVCAAGMAAHCTAQDEDGGGNLAESGLRSLAASLVHDIDLEAGAARRC